MSKLKILGKEIRALGYPEGPVISIAMNVMEKNFKHHSKEKAFDFIQSTYRGELTGIYQHNYFDHDKRDFFFNNTLFELKNKRLIELGNNYCQVLYTKDQHGWGQTMIKELSVFHVTGDVNKVIGFARSNNMN